MQEIALLTPSDFRWILARLTLLERQMATEVEAVANLTTQVTELTEAVGIVTTAFTDLKAQVAALEAAAAGNTDVAAQVTAIATTIDTAEQALRGLVGTPAPAPAPVEPPPAV
jgi:hypothetical protein